MAKLSYSQAIRETIAQEMRRDERVFVMGEDVEKLGGVYGCTRDLYKEFGTDRVRNTPISESAIIGAALGAACGGMRPIAELMYWDFAFVAADQIFNQVAKTRYVFGGNARIPLVIRGQQGTGRGNAATHSQSLESLFMHIPGLKVVCPSTPADAAGLLRTAIRDDNPVCFFEHKVLYATKGEVPDDPDFCIPFGKADIKREGTDVTIVANLLYVKRALEAADELAKEGISAEVIDPRTLVPFDYDTVPSEQRLGRPSGVPGGPDGVPLSGRRAGPHRRQGLPPALQPGTGAGGAAQREGHRGCLQGIPVPLRKEQMSWLLSLSCPSRAF